MVAPNTKRLDDKIRNLIIQHLLASINPGVMSDLAQQARTM